MSVIRHTHCAVQPPVCAKPMGSGVGAHPYAAVTVSSKLSSVSSSSSSGPSLVRMTHTFRSVPQPTQCSMLYSPCLPDTLPLHFFLTFSHRSLTAGSEDRCADPGIPAGARRSGSSFGIDDKLSYRCDEGLHLLGSKTRVCQESGQWTGTEPKCYCKDP